MVDGQERERKRLSSDLHDGFGQLISVLRLTLGKLGSDAENQTVQQSNQLLDSMYAELKAICFDMMPQALTKGGLKAGLEELAIRVNAGTNVQLQLDVYLGTTAVNERLAVAVFRIVQEWTNNVLKYAQAQQIEVSLTSDETELTVAITDNGQGFDTTVLEQATGNGWANIKQRANFVRGEVFVESTPSQSGTTLVLNIPID